MKTTKIAALTLALLAFNGVSTSKEGDPWVPAPGTVADKISKSNTELVIVSEKRWKAVLVALEHLKSRQDYNEEQRKPQNYEVWINSEEGLIKVSFLADAPPGVEPNTGGNYKTARSCTYLISPEDFKIKRVLGNK
jgi:hypothetical protein